MEIKQSKITCDLAKAHVEDSRDIDILKNDIYKLIDIVENRKNEKEYRKLKNYITKLRSDMIITSKQKIRIFELINNSFD